MAANMLLQSRSAPGFQWTPELLTDCIRELNKTVNTVNNARITSWKERSVRNLILHMPPTVRTRLQNAYLFWGWEKSFMSEDLLRQAFWKRGFKFNVAADWQTVYETTDASLLRFANKLAAEWTAQWPAPGSLESMGRREVEMAKPMKMKDTDPDLQDLPRATILALMSVFFEHWVVPRVHESFGASGVQRLED